MFVQDAYKNQAATLIKKMAKRQIDACYAATKEEAREKVIDLLKGGGSVAYGGSSTLKEIGIFDYLKSDPNIDFIDRGAAKNPEEKEARQRQAFLADYFLMSTNAITREGELVNIDGNGNRVAALAYGPKTVIVVVSLNKLAIDVDSAIARVRNAAAPPNSLRLGLHTPCASTGFCGNCTSPDCICSQIVITRFCRPAGRIKVILVGEPLGY